MLNRFLNILNDILIPKFCIGCGKLNDYVCSSCINKISILDFQHCIVCNTLSINGKTHRYCKNQLKYAPDLSISPFQYEGLIRKMLIRSKTYSKSFDYINFLMNTEANNQLVDYLSPYDLIAISPMSKRYNNPRFVNHSELIAKHFTKRKQNASKIPIIDIFTKNTNTAQKELRQSQRAHNKIFIIDKLTNSGIAKDKNILIVDDIATSGSTMIEISKLLKNDLKANSVFTYTLARSIRYNRLK